MTAIANDQRLDEQRTVSVSPLVAPSVVRAEHTPDELSLIHI